MAGLWQWLAIQSALIHHAVNEELQEFIATPLLQAVRAQSKLVVYLSASLETLTPVGMLEQVVVTMLEQHNGQWNLYTSANQHSRWVM
jgi:hypothetical protein